MFEIIESNKKDVVVIENDMLRSATEKINQYHMLTKNSILAISMILADIVEKPKEYLENSGFNSISQYAEEIFGYKKSYTYKLIKISNFVTIKDRNGEKLEIQSLIKNEINTDYIFDVLKDNDGFEYSPSQMLELIPLSKEQIKENIATLDSSLSCKELRSIVKDIVNPPIETTGESREESAENTENTENTTEIKLTDKERIIQMLEICSGMENEDIKEKIVIVFQKSLKLLEK